MMAASEESKGYDHQFVEPPPNDLLCLICLCVARDPQQINCCGKVLCKGCLEEHKKLSIYCPLCRKPITSFADKRSKIVFPELYMYYKHVEVSQIPQVRETSFLSKLDVIIQVVAVSGLGSCAHWINI